MLQTKHFLTPPETSSVIGTVIERLVLGFFAFMNLIIVYEFFSTQLGGWRASEYAQAAAYVCAVIACCAVIARSKAKTIHILWAVMLVSLALRFLYVSLIPTRPCSDFEMLYLAAQKAAAGDFSWSRAAEGYFYTWAYQIPFALYQAVLFRLSHSLLALKLFNVLFMVGTNYLLYRIGKLYLSETAALCVAFIYAVFPGVLMYASVLTNQHISMFFLLLGVFMLLRADRRRTLCLAGCMLAASDLMRPEAVLILAALLCCGLLRCIQRPDVMTVKQTALSVLLVFACYWLAKSLTEWLLIWADIAPHGLGNQYPEWKFVLGLGNTDGYGGYSSKRFFRIGRRGRQAGLCGRIDQRPVPPPASGNLRFLPGKAPPFLDKRPGHHVVLVWSGSRASDSSGPGAEAEGCLGAGVVRAGITAPGLSARPARSCSAMEGTRKNQRGLLLRRGDMRHNLHVSAH